MASINITIHVVPPPAGLSVSLALQTGTLVFDQANAADIGDYIGPVVHQKCFVQSQGEWTVFFRPDADGNRDEIVVEYGTRYNFSSFPIRSATGMYDPAAKIGGQPAPPPYPAQVIAPYVATISKNGAVIATANVPYHWWRARWRWQSAPRPVVKGLADLVAAKQILPLDLAMAWNTTSPNWNITWSGPMGTAGLTTGMGTTGDRPEIGFVTEIQADYLLNGTASSLTAMLAQAEAAGSMGIFIRDMATGAFVDFTAHPYLSLTSGNDVFGGKTHTIPAAPSGRPNPNYFVLDLAHWPAVSYVPWLLTDDPYFLESVQAGGLFSIIFTNGPAQARGLPGMAEPVQARAYAWGLREVMRAAAFSPVAPPSWLNSKAQWSNGANDNLSYMQYETDGGSTDGRNTIFHMIASENKALAAFEVDYQDVVLGWILWSGLFDAGWVPPVTWAAGCRFGLTADPGDGPGWDRRYPVPYNVLFPANPFPPGYGWLQLWNDFLAANPSVNPGSWPPNTFVPANNVQTGYAYWARASLASLIRGGLAGAANPYAWLYGQVTSAPILARNVPSGFKWAISPS